MDQTDQMVRRELKSDCSGRQGRVDPGVEGKGASLECMSKEVYMRKRTVK